VGATALGQTAAEPNEGTLAALLAEVRGLRAAMEQVASAGPRVQLAIGRLQLQEQRLDTLMRRADGVRGELASAQKRAGEMQDQLASMQQALQTEPVDAERRAQLESAISATKRELARVLTEAQRLQGEESDAANQVANEQGRWVEINQKLEELERMLTVQRR
jgi:chromosome segregation ATPase